VVVNPSTSRSMVVARRALRAADSLVLVACALAWPPAWAGPGAAPRSPAGVREVDGVVRDAQGRVLHRRLPPGDGEGGEAEFVYDPRASGTIPAELHRGEQVLEAPEADPTPGDGEGVYAPDGLRRADPAAAGGAGPEGVQDPRATFADHAAPDRATQREGRLDYHATFDPSVVPFKRNRALNAVGADYTLHLEPGAMRPLEPVGNHPTAGWEVFWGSVLLDLAPGETTPIPSVSPQSRILSYEATPPVPIAFLRDEAGNFYVRSQGGGRVRLVFVMDAPRSYFGAAIPDGVFLRDLPRSAVRRVSPRVRRAARAVARAVGVDTRRPYREVLGKLVRYFRSFEPGDPPSPTGDIYRDLALGRRGICRHRVFGFVVTALGLGIPARYVFNEAHVFAEVYVPGVQGGPGGGGWMRVDLGGGAERLVIHDAETKVRHQDAGRDPFAGTTGASGAAPGPDHAAGAQVVEGLPPTRRAGPTTSPTGASQEGTTPRSAATPTASSAGSTPSEERTGAASMPPPAPLRLDNPLARPTRTTLVVGRRVLFRGEALEASGVVTTQAGVPVRDGLVQLVARDPSGGQARLLGAARTAVDGTYRLTVTVPKELPPGSWDITAEFLGGPDLAPSRSP